MAHSSQDSTILIYSFFAFFSLTLLALAPPPAAADLLRESSILFDQTDFGEIQSPGDLFGQILATGDFDCDGIDDLVFGNPYKNLSGFDEGQVIVAHGSDDGTLGNWTVVFEQGAALGDTAEDFDQFGDSLAVGNFDGNGCDDLAIGVPRESVTVGAIDSPAAGVVHVLYGWQFAGGLSPIGSQMFHRGNSNLVLTAQSGDHFGSSLAAGDFNGDGRDDLAIGVSGDEIDGVASVGSVHVIYGGPLGLTPLDPGLPANHVLTPVLLDDEPIDFGDGFGAALAVCDFDGDDRADLAVAAPTKKINGLEAAGAVYVIHGSEDGLDYLDSQVWDLGSPGVSGPLAQAEFFGAGLAAADFDGDERCDLAVGHPYYEEGAAPPAGRVLALFGTPAGLTTTGIQSMNVPSLTGAAPTSIGFGTFLTAGDFDGDGRGDLAMAATSDGTGGAEGRVYVVHGRVDRSFELQVILDQGEEVPGDPEGYFGQGLVTGDLNGDGSSDLVVGNHFYNETRGAAIVFYSLGIFSEGFESGDLSGWSGVSP